MGAEFLSIVIPAYNESQNLGAVVHDCWGLTGRHGVPDDVATIVSVEVETLHGC